MGEAVFDEVCSFAGQKSLAAAAVLCRTPHGNLHAGLMHKRGDDVCFLHLAWQDMLDDRWEYTKLWAAPDVEPERLVSVAALCRRIWAKFTKDRSFPYGIRFAGTSFDVNGQLCLGPNARGLTCATFILAVFKSMGIDLVDEADWPVRTAEDSAFVESLAGFTAPGHLKLLREEVASGVRRIRPDEVLGACACALPSKFASAREAADRVLRNLPAP